MRMNFNISVNCFWFVLQQFTEGIEYEILSKVENNEKE